MADKKDGLALPTHYPVETSLHHHPLAASRYQHDTLIAEILAPLASIRALQSEMERVTACVPQALLDHQRQHPSGLKDFVELLDSAKRVVVNEEIKLNKEIDFLTSVTQGNNYEWEGANEERQGLERERACLQEQLAAICTQNDAEAQLLTEISHPLDQSHVEQMELDRASVIVKVKPLPHHPETLNLIQALTTRQKRQKQWLSALDRDIAQVENEGMETEERLQHEATLGQAVTEKRQRVQELRGEKKRTAEAKNSAIKQRQRMAVALCEEGMQRIAERYSGLEARMKNLLARTMKIVLASQAPQEL